MKTSANSKNKNKNNNHRRTKTLAAVSPTVQVATVAVYWAMGWKTTIYITAAHRDEAYHQLTYLM